MSKIPARLAEIATEEYQRYDWKLGNALDDALAALDGGE